MKKLLLFIALITGVTTATFGFIQGETSSETPKVYICQGSMSVCYHTNKDCEGLIYCTTDLKQITLEEAKKLGRRPCKVCCK